MVRILLIVFISAFSLVFGGCSVCKIKDNVLIEKLIELCADVEWLFKSYEERIEYSLRPFLDNIKGDFKEYQDLREKAFRFVEDLELPREGAIEEEKIESFLKEFFGHDIIEEEAYIFAKKHVEETLKDLNSYYLEKKIDFQNWRKELQEDKTAEKYINHIVFLIYIAKDTIEKKNKKSLEFISELNKLYESEHGEVGGFVKLQQRKVGENCNNSVYNIDELYRIFGEFFNKKSNAGVDIQAKALADAVVNFYEGRQDVDRDKQLEMFKKEIGQINKDITRTCHPFREYFKEHFKEQKEDAEFREILSKMLFFAVFCIRVINEKEDFLFSSVNDIRKELSGMQGLGEKQIQEIYEGMKKGCPSVGYFQGLNFFAGFFVTLYFIVNQKFGVNVNKEEMIDESGIIKLFVFYLLHKWECDSSVNYLPSCSLYDICTLPKMPVFIFLRRCKLLHMYTDYDFNNILLCGFFTGLFFAYRPSKTTNNNDCLNYIMYLDLHLYIVKKNINFYFDWFNFLYYKILHIIEKEDLKYYGDGPYTEIVKVLFSSDENINSFIQNIFFSEKKYDYIFKNFRKKNICTIF